MGCCFSNRPGFHDVISDELLTYELAGEILEDDYLGKSYLFLRKYKPESPQSSSSTSSSLSYDEAISQLYLDLSSVYLALNPNCMNELENGYVRGFDGSLYISCTIDLGDCNGEMFDWWHRACDTSDRYRWTQPSTHLFCSWEPSFSHTHLSDRKPGYYIDFLQTLQIKLNPDIIATTSSISSGGGRNNKSNNYLLTLSYERPSKHFDMSKFHEQGVTACICARIHHYDSLVGWIGIGYVIHLVRRCTNKSEQGVTVTSNQLESRYWFGQNINKMAHTSCFCRPTCVNAISNTACFRQLKLTENFAKSIWLHCYQEMNCLKLFLPHFYAKSIKMGLVYGRNANEDENESDQIVLSISSSSSKSSKSSDIGDNNKNNHDDHITLNSDEEYHQPPSVSVTTTPRGVHNNNTINNNADDGILSDRSIISETTSCGVGSVLTEQQKQQLQQHLQQEKLPSNKVEF